MQLYTDYSNSSLSFVAISRQQVSNTPTNKPEIAAAAVRQLIAANTAEWISYAVSSRCRIHTQLREPPESAATLTN